MPTADGQRPTENFDFVAFLGAVSVTVASGLTWLAWKMNRRKTHVADATEEPEKDPLAARE